MGSKFSTISSLDCSVPQGSLAGLNLYSAYASTLQEIVPDDVGLNGFANNHSLKRSFKADDRKAEQATISALQKLSHECKDMDGSEETADELWKDSVYHVWSQETTSQMQN